LDQDLEELIDNALEVGEEDEQELLDKYMKDLWSQDKDNIRKVIERAYNSKKRKRDQFELDLGDDDKVKKKLKRMEEFMKMLEESENVYYRFEDVAMSKENDEDDIFKNEDQELKKFFDLFKAKAQMKKMIDKQTTKVVEERVSLLDENEKFTFISKKGQTTLENSLHQENHRENNNKPTLARQNTMNKNSILRVKTDMKNISALNNYFNKEIMNEYGNKASVAPGEILEIINEKSNSNSNAIEKLKKKTTKPEKAGTNALSSLFASNNDQKNPSPSKLFMFRIRNKK